MHILAMIGIFLFLAFFSNILSVAKNIDAGIANRKQKKRTIINRDGTTTTLPDPNPNNPDWYDHSKSAQHNEDRIAKLNSRK